jgi:hypothetical protein
MSYGGRAGMGTILIEKVSVWRRMFFQDRVTASELQKAGLARVLCSRYHKLRAGQLYSADRRLLGERTKAITLDTGMMLIGLSECLRCSAKAEKALRDIMMLFFGALEMGEIRHIDQAKLDLRHQLRMLNLWTQYRANTPLPPVLNFAAALLSHGDHQLHQSQDQKLTRLAAALLPDAWAIYSKTVSFFGYTVDEPAMSYALEVTPNQLSRKSEGIRQRLH